MPVEILVYIGSYMDLGTTQIFRTTCRTLNHYIPQYHFAFHNTTVEQLEAIEQQLAQRVSDRISVDFRDPPLKLRLQALKAIESISLYTNITSLNIFDLTSDLYTKHARDTRVTMLTLLSNLERLAIQSYVLEPILTTLNGLTKLTVNNMQYWRLNNLSMLTNLHDLTLPNCEMYDYSSISSLTRLHIEASPQMTTWSSISTPTTLKQLIITLKHKDTCVKLTPNRWHAAKLEHVKLDILTMPSEIALNTNLTRLEIRCHETACDLTTLEALTQLQHLDLTIKQMTAPMAFTFLTKLPLRSAHLSIAKLDNTQAIQYFNTDILHHLGLEIDANSKYKDHLTRLTELESITLTASMLQSVTLTSLTRLTRLKLHQVQCGTVAPFTRLKVLSVVGNQRVLGGLNSLTNLEQLECALKPTELNYLSALTRLQDLQLTVKGSVQANVLARLSQLTYLKLTTYNVPSLAWLTSLTRLDHLDLLNCSIKPENFKLLTALRRITQLKVHCDEPSTGVLFKLTCLQRIQFAPFKQPPQGNFKEQLIKHLPHFVALKINLELEDGN